MKKDKLWIKESGWKMEPASAIIIAGSLFLCILVSMIGVWDARKSVESAAHTAAQAAALQTPSVPDTKKKENAQLSDPLLVLVNDWTPLPEEWQVTPRMVGDEQVDLKMYEALMDMFDAAGKEEVWFWVASGYRSVEEQEAILDRAVQENLENGMEPEEAREEALRTIQRPGYSEHHTGLAVDLNDVSDNFEKSEAYRWLSEHAAEYGFIQRYQASKADLTGIDNESWHYRYVGKKHAKKMKEMDFCLEEYVEYLKKTGG